MTQNPFGENPLDALGEALGGALGGPGGLDMGALLEQATQMQQQLVEAQERLAETEFSGTVAGGAVTVGVSGVGELKSVQIKAGGFDGTDADDLADLGDMIVAAYRDAKANADAEAADLLGPLAGGMGGGLPGQGGPGLPGGLGF
ncbi:YbaB/EbfC family nucleoid-associated protein [Nocardioides limicola]|uniref:YbaB/EbfC family nucleoid-associated protein n=1 Tax=Nocardioides limicola TaxID=2803368 RepID=UPI00193B6E87|nr:YbaB/EbfC family nucleoid-associated protein [Nocardioides sp. DJM-14]